MRTSQVYPQQSSEGKLLAPQIFEQFHLAISARLQSARFAGGFQRQRKNASSVA
jgi:hypothetical protein